MGLILVHAFIAILVDLGYVVLFVFGLGFAANPTGETFKFFAALGIYPAILSLTLPWSIIAYNLKKHAQGGWVSLGAVAIIPMLILTRLLF